jgi:hypothetical protein
MTPGVSAIGRPRRRSGPPTRLGSGLHPAQEPRRDPSSGPCRSPWASNRLAGLGLATTVALVLLVALGRSVPGPPWAATARPWGTWADAVGPGGVVMGLVRVAALAGVAYLLVVVLVELTGRWSAAPALLRTSHRLCLPGMTLWLSQAAAAGLLASMVAGSALTAGAAGAATPPPGAVVMHQLPPTTALGIGDSRGTGSQPARSSRARVGDGPPVMVVVGSSTTTAPPGRAPSSSSPTPSRSESTTESTSGRPTPDPAPAVPGPGISGPESPPPAATTPNPAPQTWIIRSGDHLWRVASTTLAAQWSARPNDAEVLDYLHQLIAANRDLLVVPTDPDLVFPGQVFVLPPVPVRPT